jgi:hypothetical protein
VARALRRDGARLLEGLPHHAERARLGEGEPGRLSDEGHRAARARVHLEHVHVLPLDGELDVHEPDDAELLRERDGLALDPPITSGARLKGESAQASPE